MNPSIFRGLIFVTSFEHLSLLVNVILKKAIEREKKRYKVD